MLETLNKKNNHKIYSVLSPEFKTFGRVLEGFDTKEIINAANTIEMPESGSVYTASEAKFECLKIAEQIKDECYGTLPTQIGYCYGHSNLLNGAEWHTSSEINIAITDLVLILGHVWDLEDNKIDSSKFTSFFVPKGTVVEVYATSLHFCPCETDKAGFGCVVALPTDTNTPLTETPSNPLLFRRNKWIVAHNLNEGLIARGVVSGISGENTEIKY